MNGYIDGEGVKEDPADGSEEVLTIRLTVESDLEPHWDVVKESNPETKSIFWRDRQKLGLSRIGDDTDRHLTWGRGSALAKITERQESAVSVLALANRVAWRAIDRTEIDDQILPSQLIQGALNSFGVRCAELKPGLDTKSFHMGSGALSLYNDKIPFKGFGLGTKKLTALAIQRIGLGKDAILLVDEIEHRLEPHRIRQLLKQLRESMKVDQQVPENKEQPQGQIIMTTHSPTHVMALEVETLRFVRSINGITTIERVSSNHIDSLQKVVRTQAHALLSRKIIVCEGKTELGLCNVLDDYWAINHENKSFAFQGIVAINGGGRTQGPAVALEFRRIGYDVLFFGDSDEPIELNQQKLEKSDIKTVLWPGNMCTEQRLCHDLPIEHLQKIVDTAVKTKGLQSVVDAINHKLGNRITTRTPKMELWIINGLNEQQIRVAIGLAAKEKSWFKDINTGMKLGKIVTQALTEIPDSPTAKILISIENWVHD